ncbi:hypothetical protein [Paenibacillus eucommiae]|uniref:DNA-binding CsgD family transcriptional regulator n=1 Tax=Paenibacillus eucommiae TaxID=1355755 RepID=A0ABS4IMI2_9BACL|nr:hypothetical protein [Paenibacillus eucommiae]MBP1988779.1 DNA-binding CsgD family transcriptional regulator [Paenibacillus eucommiae]
MDEGVISGETLVHRRCSDSKIQPLAVPLTNRETERLQALAEGLSNVEGAYVKLP